MSALAVAVKRREWEIVALCLLLGVAESASKLPAETLDVLLDLLSKRREDAAR